jgi:predicted  nucleic acid-binding Zn-ribbon protein
LIQWQKQRISDLEDEIQDLKKETKKLKFESSKMDEKTGSSVILFPTATG